MKTDRSGPDAVFVVRLPNKLFEMIKKAAEYKAISTAAFVRMTTKEAAERVLRERVRTRSAGASAGLIR